MTSDAQPCGSSSSSSASSISHPTHESTPSARTDLSMPPFPTLASEGLVQLSVTNKPDPKISASTCTGTFARANAFTGKPGQLKFQEAVFTADGRMRSGCGDARAATEDRMAAEMARIGQEKGLIDDETARNWSLEWHTKGELIQSWTKETRSKYGPEDDIVPEEISLEDAERIKMKQDADLEEWVMAFEEGFIDENGIQKDSGEAFVAMTYKRLMKSRQRDTKLRATKKDMSKKEQEVLVTESTASRKAHKKSITDESTSSKSPSDAGSLMNMPKESTNQDNVNEAANKKRSSKAKVIDDKFSVLPLPGLPNYQEYKYNDLAALCRERNIRSGGGEQKVRNRLIQDDMYVVDSEFDKRDAKNYSHVGRAHQTVPPIVENAPKSEPAVLTTAMRSQQRAMRKAPDMSTNRHAYASKRIRDNGEEERDDEHERKRTKTS